MLFKEYNKLVRDKVPYFIRKDNEVPSYRRLTLEEYKEALRQKLIEEAIEVANAKSIGELLKELADLLEVLYALVKVHHITLSDIERVRKDRAHERGVFGSRIFLKYTEPKLEAKSKKRGA